ncbi:MAG: hypothetical protein U0694_05205 [Anaerolineae bacterium]
MLWQVTRRLALTLAFIATFGLLIWVFYLRELRPNQRGVHLLLDDGRNSWDSALWAEHLQYARQWVGDGGYVVELIRADDLNIEKWQYFLDLCDSLSVTPVLRLATTYDHSRRWWNAPTADADGSYRMISAQFAAFIAGLEWPASEHYVIVGNEPNHGDEWGGRPDPAAYARYLMDVAAALHALDPQIRVLNAGLDPYAPNTGSIPFDNSMYYLDEESFLDGMFLAYPDVFSSIDVWASHSYPQGPFTQPPWVQTYGRDMLNGAVNLRHQEPPAGIFNRGVNGYEWELWKLADFGVEELPVMITETGWRHAESIVPHTLDNAPQPLPDVDTVRQYLDMAFYGNDGRYQQYPTTGWTPWANDARLIGVVLFALDGVPAEWGHSNWLTLDADGHVLDTYAMFDLLGR